MANCSHAAFALQVASNPVAEYHSDHSCRAARVKTVVVFGDSYSDTRNLAKATRVKLYDFAYAGATTDSALAQGYSGVKEDLPVPGFLQQIEQFYASLALSPKALASTVFIVNFQGNDFFYSKTATPADVVTRLDRGIHRLIGLGARNILIVGNCNYGLVPFLASDPAAVENFSKNAKQEQQLIHDLKRKLHQEFGVPPRLYPFRQCDALKLDTEDGGCHHKPESRVRVALFDQLAFFEYLHQPENLKRLGIKDVKGQCETDDFSSVCSNPGDYFYWDSVHVSAKVHRVLANAILAYF
ncbi:hypothetical protein DFQ26_007673 [Actinomortierella ambigua]|nr:hypothetical protein DFQ26_007673 [Actinomortierella ambigua]